MPRTGDPSALRYRPDQDFRGDEPEPGAGGDIVVSLDDFRKPASPNFKMDGDDAVNADEAPADPVDDGGDFYRNLALDFDEETLDKIGRDITEQVIQDEGERSDWKDRFERGMEQMGLIESDIDDGPFPGASNAVHPLLIEARTQFWARAMGELFPPEGPCKTKVMGNQTEPDTNRGLRVAEYMNFDMTVQDEAYQEEMSSLIWDLPFYGSCFDKTFPDPVLGQTVTIYVPAEDMIVPAEGRSLKTTPRFAHRMRKSPNEVRRLQIAKYYRDNVDLGEPGDPEPDEIRDIKDETQDIRPDGDDVSNQYELFEVCIDLDLEGDEHVGDDGEPTGLQRSYYVTVDRVSSKVLSIYRGWDEGDELCRRRLYCNHWKFAPGAGFYGSGLFHLIGGLQVAATGALRVLLDSAASASLSGGFVSRHANLKGKRLVLTPGQWEPVDATGEDLAKAFFSPPVKEPSAALFQLLGFLTERGEKYSATTELQTGDADPKNSPVGTTQMMIEQGGKVMSTIHRMMFVVLGRQIRTRYQLCREYAPQGGYPYDAPDGQQQTVYYEDFAPGLKIVPVADPNIFTSAQRMAQNQALYQIATETGALPMPKVIRRVLQGLRIPDIDELLPADEEPQVYDPIGEVQAMFLGKPVRVIPSQMHVMHIQVLAAFAQNPQYAGNKEVQKQIGPALLSVLGQHMAYAWATHARGLGAPVGYMDPQSGQVMGGGTPEQIAAVLARVAPQLATVPGMPAIDSEGDDKDSKGELELKRVELDMKREEHQQDMQMAREKQAMEIQKAKDKLEADKQMNQQKVAVAGQKAASDAQVAKIKADQTIQQSQMDANIKQQQATHQAQVDQQQADQQAQVTQQQMHQEAQLGQQEMHQKHQQGQQKMHLEAQKSQTQQQVQPADRLGHLKAPHKPQSGQ